MKINRLFHTLIHLKPIQILYRFKRKFSSTKLKRFKNVQHKNVDLFIDGLHNNEIYLKRFKTADNSIEILNQNIELDYRNTGNLSPLVRFNLEYFEYAIVWSQTGFDFDFLKAKWNEYIRADLKPNPYIISLQIPNLVIAMNVYKADDQEIYDELYSRYRWLIKHQEKDLLANHYLENLKTIVISSYIFNEKKVFNKYIRKLEKECREQILDDGVHFELSFMYHKLILEDLLVIRKIFNGLWLNQYIQKMLNAIVSLESGIDRTPLFNDCGDNVAKSVRALAIGSMKSFGFKPMMVNSFNDSGYYKIMDNNLSVIIDCGIVGPNYNPGHSHCDCLSFELYNCGSPLFVNSGTYQYQGNKRTFFRSSCAHNVAIIENHEQSDCWGEHRVGKRIKRESGIIKDKIFFGSMTNQFGEEQKRKIIVKENTISVLDYFPNSKKGLSVVSCLHLAPGFVYENGSIVGYGNKFKVETISCSVKQIDSFYASNFGKLESNKCLLFRWRVDDKEHGYNINLNN